MCVYCGAEPQTRDHVPSRVLLDEPYPLNLPVVDACEDCNSSFSQHEQYVACLIECALTGSSEPAGAQRAKIRRVLEENPSLRHRLFLSREIDDDGNITWLAEVDRVKTVLLKLARGHAAYELGLPQLDGPRDVAFTPFAVMSDQERDVFECFPQRSLIRWPEVGSRAFIRAVRSAPSDSVNGWLTVQSGRYRYKVEQTDGLVVQIVLSEYLACRIVWD